MKKLPLLTDYFLIIFCLFLIFSADYMYRNIKREIKIYKENRIKSKIIDDISNHVNILKDFVRTQTNLNHYRLLCGDAGIGKISNENKSITVIMTKNTTTVFDRKMLMQNDTVILNNILKSLKSINLNKSVIYEWW